MDMQLIWVFALTIHVLFVFAITRATYDYMLKRGIEPIRAVYFNRKIVHMVGSGIPTLMVPYIFSDFWFPTLGGILLGLLIHICHSTNYRLYWFQTPENRNDVSFAVMWWVSLSILWWLLDDPWLAILPALLMSFGDGVTGVVRNIYVRRRSKHIIGSAFMLLVSLPLGVWVAAQASPPIPIWGALTAIFSTWIERYEFGPIDDNILIAVVSMTLLIIGHLYGPIYISETMFLHSM